MTELDDFSIDPRFVELHEELRHVVLAGILTLSPSRLPSPEPELPVPALEDTAFDGPDLDFSTINIPQSRLVRYLENWVTECAPILDKFDTNRQFQVQVPLIARTSPAVLYAVLTFSSRQMERRGAPEVMGCYDSPQLYQETIRRLSLSLQAKDARVLVAACILAVLELMSWNSTDWRRHLEGCAALLGFFGVDGFSGGIAQAMFWCYARMEVCGAIISDGTETAVLPVSKWVPAVPDSELVPLGEDAEFVRAVSHHYGAEWHPDLHANWATYLCARVCDLRFRRTQHLELGKGDAQDARLFPEQWRALWRELQRWLDERPPAMIPVPNIMSTSSHQQQPNRHPFPVILFSHTSAISGNQLYHTACILMLEMRPPDFDSAGPESSQVWHARRVCGISSTSPHQGSRINAIQPLYVAGRLFTHASERREIARLLRDIHRTTGWGAWWRLRDLEAEWGCEYSEDVAVT